MKKQHHVIRIIACFLLISTSAMTQTISWEPSNNHLFDMTVRSILVGQDRDLFIGDNRGEMYRSVDDGQSWSQIASPDGGVISGIAELSSGKLLVINGTYLYASMNAGETWEFLDHNLSPVTIRKFIVTDEDHLFGATEEGVLYSEDEGITWVKRNTGLTDMDIGAIVLNQSGILIIRT